MKKKESKLHLEETKTKNWKGKERQTKIKERKNVKKKLREFSNWKRFIHKETKITRKKVKINVFNRGIK